MTLPPLITTIFKPRVTHLGTSVKVSHTLLRDGKTVECIVLETPEPKLELEETK